MSQLIEFYRGEGTDSEGRSIQEIWTWDDDELESVHDFIQWLFPLQEPSQFNPEAPLLTAEDVAAFRSDPQLQANLKTSFERLLTFLGFSMAADGQVIEGDNFRERFLDVWSMPNHNWLRITRILRSLTVLELGTQAQALYERLSAYYESRRFPISATTFEYWTQAVRDGL